jgi:cytochrome c peroxidase
MMRRSLNILAVVVFSAFALNKKREFNYPKTWPKPVYDFSQNELTDQKVLLGRILFYDPILSKDSTISCASCHSSYSAFAHIDHDLSHGIGDQIGNRNAPGLINLAWQPIFMWDGAITQLDMQALAPLSHPKEMNEELAHVIHKLEQTKLYPTLFKQAWGDENITGEHFLKSITQFMLNFVSKDSKYDRMKRGEIEFTSQEKNGYEIFREQCNACHTEPLFTNYQFKNNGLSEDPDLHDQGRFNITQLESDKFHFKIPTLRNIAFTYPYMHDGRFKKLSQVLQHYNSLNESSDASPELKKVMQMNETQLVDLQTFLLTLSDTAFVFRKEYEYPKKQLSELSKDHE